MSAFVAFRAAKGGGSLSYLRFGTVVLMTVRNLR